MDIPNQDNMYFSINWELLWRRKDVIGVQITFIDKEGNVIKKEKHYKEWIGICTNNIENVISNIQKFFPGEQISYIQITKAKKVLPYFEERIVGNKLEYKSKSFYKVYTTASHKSIGRLFNKYKISYFDPDEWLIRIYIDLCIRYDTNSFYYKWYNFQNDSKNLLKSLKMISDCTDEPDWTIAAFDIEAVPLKGNHIPVGHHETDRIVMLSIYKWNRKKGIQKWLLYLLPDGGGGTAAAPLEEPLAAAGADKLAFQSESEMLVKFHKLLDDAQVLTGYNINAFDFPCIFARLLWLKQYRVIKKYSSVKVGSDTVVSYNGKLVLDLYTYFKTFSNYNLPSFKLDDVARVKLGGDTKLQVKSTGIWIWYRKGPVAANLLAETDVDKCFALLQPETVSKSSEFGTFGIYLDYCLKDSELVYRLFEKEMVLSLLIGRANFTALSVVQVLHFGNSRYLLEMFKTYAIRLGYLVNPKFFVGTDESKYQAIFKGDKTYQGALNFCTPEKVYEDVSVMDFASMYPSTLLSSNLCYGTCTIMSRDEWLIDETAQKMTCIAYRKHSDADFTIDEEVPPKFVYPRFNPDVDEFAIVINMQTEAFLPQFVSHFIKLRQHHQREWKQTKNVYHYNAQLCIKILINSLYGVMANKDSDLAYLPIAMIIVTLSRYQLLGSYHYIKNLGYSISYIDTDSLMVHKWPVDNCNLVNEFLGIPNVELKYEQRMKRLLVLSKKRYIYEQMGDNNKLVKKGFQKKTNGLIESMTEEILESVWDANFIHPEKAMDPVNGWIVWVNTILNANYKCRDPKKYSIYRKIKSLEEYKSTSCPSVKFIKKYPDKTGDHVEFTYSRADVAAKEASNWIMDVQDCQWVNYEQLFISQKRIFCLLLNMTFWHLSDPIKPADMVLNTLHWKRFVHAELLHWHATGRRLVLMVEPGVKYTFQINDHLFKERKRGRGKKTVLI